MYKATLGMAFPMRYEYLRFVQKRHLFPQTVFILTQSTQVWDPLFSKLHFLTNFFLTGTFFLWIFYYIQLDCLVLQFRKPIFLFKATLQISDLSYFVLTSQSSSQKAISFPFSPQVLPGHFSIVIKH